MCICAHLIHCRCANIWSCPLVCNKQWVDFLTQKLHHRRRSCVVVYQLLAVCFWAQTFCTFNFPLPPYRFLFALLPSGMKSRFLTRHCLFTSSVSVALINTHFYGSYLIFSTNVRTFFFLQLHLVFHRARRSSLLKVPFDKKHHPFQLLEVHFFITIIIIITTPAVTRC